MYKKQVKNCKKTLAAALIASFALSTAINAGELTATASGLTEAKQGGIFFSSAVVGGIAGGPLGFIAGAAAGIWLGEEVKKAEQVDDYTRDIAHASDQLSEQQSRLESMQERLTIAEASSANYAQMALEQLELAMLFKTNQTELSAAGKQRMLQLGDFLRANPDIHVRLDGYADPRGDAEYDMLLSSQRVSAVAEQLQSLGLDSQRLSIYSHGAEQSAANKGDYDAYAMERLVRIQLSREGSDETVAQVDISQ